MRHTQRGVFSVVAAAIMVVVVLIIALALDTGRFYLEQRRLQGAADAAALAAARELVARENPAELAGAVAATARRAAQQNGFEGALAEDAIEIGHVQETGGVYQFVAGYATNGSYGAVRVTAARSVPRSLVAPGLLPGNLLLRATAVARREARGGLRVGTFLAGVDTAQSTLLNPIVGGLLGGNVALTAAGYNTLIAGRIALGELQAAVGADSLVDLLSTNLTLGSFLAAGARALSTQGNALAAVQLNDLALAANPNLRITIGDLLKVTTNAGSIADATVNVFGLVMASAQLANQSGHHLVNVNLDTATGLLSSLGLADLRLGLRVIEAPQIEFGPPGRHPITREWLTQVRSGQVELTLHLETLNLNLLGLITTSVKLDLLVEAAQGRAWLAAIHAATPDNPHHRADVGVETTIARLGIGTRDSAGHMVPTTLLKVNIPLLLRVTATAVAEFPLSAPTSRTLQFTGPFVPTLAAPAPGNTDRIGTDPGDALAGALDGLLAGTDIVVDLRVLGLGIGITTGQVTSALSALLDPLLGSLATTVLAPLLDSLGIQLGGADVTVIYLDPGEPRLML